MSRRLLAADVRAVELTEPVPAGAEVLGGDPQARVADLASIDGVDVGIWSLTPGAVRDVEDDEVFVVLSGRGVVTFEDGESIALHAGVAVRLRAGERTHWVVSETLRKVYVSG